MTLQIRPFASDDRPDLIQAIEAVCGEGCWMRTICFEPTPSWIHALEEPLCACHLLLVVENARHVVGWCRTFPEEGRDEAREATLGIGLLPPYRDRGIGTALVRQSLSWAKNAGYQCVRLTTHPDNARAIHVFTRCEFTFTGQGSDNWLEMTCDLACSLNVQGEGDCESPIN